MVLRKDHQSFFGFWMHRYQFIRLAITVAREKVIVELRFNCSNRKEEAQRFSQNKYMIILHTLTYLRTFYTQPPREFSCFLLLARTTFLIFLRYFCSFFIVIYIFCILYSIYIFSRCWMNSRRDVNTNAKIIFDPTRDNRFCILKIISFNFSLNVYML